MMKKGTPHQFDIRHSGFVISDSLVESVRALAWPASVANFEPDRGFLDRPGWAGSFFPDRAISFYDLARRTQLCRCAAARRPQDSNPFGFCFSRDRPGELVAETRTGELVEQS